MQIQISSFVKCRERHWGAKEPHATPEPQVVDPGLWQCTWSPIVTSKASRQEKKWMQCLIRPSCRNCTSIVMVNLIIARKCGTACQIVVFAVNVLLFVPLVTCCFWRQLAHCSSGKSVVKSAARHCRLLAAYIFYFFGLLERHNILVFLSPIDRRNVATAASTQFGRKSGMTIKYP